MGLRAPATTTAMSTASALSRLPLPPLLSPPPPRALSRIPRRSAPAGRLQHLHAPTAALPRRRPAAALLDDSDDEEEDDEGAGLRPKPRGFGEGKTYDTSIEDQLLRELALSKPTDSRKPKPPEKPSVQAAPSRRRSGKPNSAEASPAASPSSRVSTSGSQVRLLNLPKKKNIHRDLQQAFEGFQGLVNISPVVSASKKTRDPVCKGLAFVEFQSREAATRFVQLYSEKTVQFGKVQKQISCSVISSSHEPSTTVVDSSNTSNIPIESRATIDEESGMSCQEQISLESTHVDDYSDVNIVCEPSEAFIDQGDSPLCEVDEFDSQDKQKSPIVPDVVQIHRRNVDTSNFKSLVQSSERETNQAIVKKKKTKLMPMKAASLRLKYKEKSMLAGVMSKYGEKTE